MKKAIISLAVLFSGFSVVAQETVPAKKFWDDPVNHPMMPLYAVSTLVFITVILLIVTEFYMLGIINLLVSQSRRQKADRDGEPYTVVPSVWKRIAQKLNASVPLAQEQGIDTGHNFDGIRELDNYLPPWWKWLFIGTIGWSAVYILIFHISSSLPLSTQEYENEVARAKAQADRAKASQPKAVVDEDKLVYTNDAAILENGKLIFIATCVPCHRADGGGNSIGPNLTDEYWIHGGSIQNIFSTIKNGQVDKGMPEWGKAMSAQDVRDVTFYVMSLQNSAPANAKAPQGEKFIPEKNINPYDSSANASL